MTRITNYTGQVFDTVEEYDEWVRKEVEYLTAQHERTMQLMGCTGKSDVDPEPFRNGSIRYPPGHINGHLTDGD